MAKNSAIEWTDPNAKGKALGAQKSAAKKVGLDLDEWRRRINSGLSWCYHCKTWKPRGAFGKDKSRSTGLTSACKPCVSEKGARSRYGLSRAEFESLVSVRCCPICKRDDQCMEIDHCHKTGKVREYICSACNGAMGQLRDDPYLLRRAAAYLEKHNGR